MAGGGWCERRIKTLVSLGLAWAILIGALPDMASALPHGGVITHGRGTLGYNPAKLTVHQGSQSMTVNWSIYNVKVGQTVVYVQPNSSSVALNIVNQLSPSLIAGKITANGILTFLNPYGFIFASGSQVNAAGVHVYAVPANSSPGSSLSPTGNVTASGSIAVAPGGVVSLTGTNVSNGGTISAPRGGVILAAGTKVTIDDTSVSSLSVVVNRSTRVSTVNNTGDISAKGGTIILAAGGKDSLVASAVNDSGGLYANTAGGHSGKITLLSGMTAGTTSLSRSAVLSASAPGGGNGGSIETSGARVNVADGTVVTTAAPQGRTGTWVLDPNSFYIGKNPTVTPSGTFGKVLNYEDISGSQLSTDLGSNNMVIDSTQGAKGTLGNIYVNDQVSWSTANKLTLNAMNNIELNNAITNSDSSLAGGILGNTVLSLRADDMAIGGKATNAAGGGVPSGNGTVVVNGGSISLASGNANIYYNPTKYTTPATYTNANGAGPTLSAFMLLSTNPDLYYIDQNQTSTILPNNYALNGNITLPTVTSGTLSGADLAQATYATETNTGSSSYTQGSSTNSNWVRFGGSSSPFTGTFSGQGYAISNTTIDDTVHSHVGFVGEMKNGTVENLGMAGGSTSSDGDTGGLVGYNNSGTVLNTYATGSVSANASGLLLSTVSVGGLVGYNSGTISNSYATGSVSGTSSGLLNSVNVGGFAGYNSGTISNSYATGSISVSVSLLSVASVGGFVGNNFSGTYIDDYWNTTTTGQSNAYSGATGSAPNITGLASGTGTGKFSNSGSWTFQSSFNTWNSTTGSFSSSAYTNPWTWGTATIGGTNVAAPILVSDMGTATIAANSATMTYNGSPYSIGSNYTATGANLAGTVGLSSASSNDVNAGSYTVTPLVTALSSSITQTDAGFFTYAGGSLTINPTTLTETANGATMTYGGTVPAVTGSLSTPNIGASALSSLVTATWSTSASSSSIVGSYAINPTLSYGKNADGSAVVAGDFTAAPASGNATALAVSPKALTFSGSVTNPTKTYDGTTAATLTTGNSAASLGGFVNNQSATYTGATGSYSSPNAGTGISVTSTLGSGNFSGSGTGFSWSNYSLPSMVLTGTGTIDKATLTAMAHGASMTYGASVPALSGSVTGFVNGQTLSSDGGSAAWSTTASSASPVGSYAISGTVTLGSPYSGDYTVTQASGNATALAVGKKALTFSLFPATVNPGSGTPLPPITDIREGIATIIPALFYSGTALEEIFPALIFTTAPSVEELFSDWTTFSRNVVVISSPVFPSENIPLVRNGNPSGK